MLDRILPILWLLAGGAAAFGVDRLASLRRPGGERGDFWSRVTQWFCLLLAPALLVSGSLQVVLPSYWRSGRHLHLDLTTAFGWSFDTSFRVALSVPFLLWLLLLAVFVAQRPRRRAAVRWLAGAIGFGERRSWVLLCCIPLVLLLALQWSHLNQQGNGYPAATWSTLAVVAICLIGVAGSSGTASGKHDGTAPQAAAGRSLPQWPKALKAKGIGLQPLVSWASQGLPRPAGPGAGPLVSSLERQGARGIAPELVEAIAELLEPGTGDTAQGHTRLVFAPDDCGQAECVAQAALHLDQRAHASTLIITAGGTEELASRLRRWGPTAKQVMVVQGGSGKGLQAPLWVVDAETLSDRLLAQFRDGVLVGRIGLVVWWHLEAYTGVLGANLWAISRRLHRLLSTYGRHDVRTLALVRSAPYASAQMGEFVRRLLPHPFPAASEVHVPTHFSRAIDVHLLGGHRSYFEAGHGQGLAEGSRHPLMVAAGVSAQIGWPTHLEGPRGVSETELTGFLQRSTDGEKLEEKLVHEPASSGARLREIGSRELLSLREIACQGGRNAAEGSIHHLALERPSDPYCLSLVQGLANGKGASALASSRRLICAEAQASLIRRHLLSALNELPSTHRQLLETFQWNEEIIRETLEQISFENKLAQREVRYLGEDDRLVIDREVRSRRMPGGGNRPLDTVGSRLIDVRSPAEALEGGGVRLRVDPERLTIKAYPHRVFMAQGRRYRVEKWSSLEGIVERGWVRCRQEAAFTKTWRIRNSYVYDLEPLEASEGIGRRGRILTRQSVALQYEEEILGTLRWAPDLTTGGGEVPEVESLDQPISQSFPTRGLVLRFPEPAGLVALKSLCQALRHVLPVHLGVEDDSIEVVPLSSELLSGQEVNGFAIVDLFPEGIGLVDSIRGDGTFLLELLAFSRSWLEDCPCSSRHGCELCLRSPAAQAANYDQPPKREAALKLLRRIQ